jgi:hypothetical protein
VNEKKQDEEEVGWVGEGSVSETKIERNSRFESHQLPAHFATSARFRLSLLTLSSSSPAPPASGSKSFSIIHDFDAAVG